MDAKMRAKAAALGISVQSITPELAAKWGILMSPGQRRGQSKPAAPNSTALPEGEQQPDEFESQEALDKKDQR